MTRLECKKHVSKDMSYASEITLPWKLERDPPPFEGNDIKFPESLARYVIETYTKPKAKVFDPFAGMGTTLFVAEELGRTPFGMETELHKYEWVAGQLENWMNHRHDDAALCSYYDFPKMDLVLTSPPYMPRHHEWNPLYNGNPQKAGYRRYLKRMGIIFKNVTEITKKNGFVFIQVDNLKHGKVFTPLIRDISNAVDPYLKQVDEIKVNWKRAKEDYPFTTLLVFKKN